jgi:hypothetical protein
MNPHLHSLLLALVVTLRRIAAPAAALLALAAAALQVERGAPFAYALAGVVPEAALPAVAWTLCVAGALLPALALARGRRRHPAVTPRGLGWAAALHAALWTYGSLP